MKISKEDLIKYKDSKTMCILPWIHMHPWPNGKTMLCCDSPWETNIGDLTKNTLQEVWNSEDMRKVRLNMLNNQGCKQCIRCYEKENYGHDSLRTRSNRDWLEKHWDKVVQTKEDGSLDEMHIVYLDFRFSNLCNLRCRYCGPELSSSWFQDAIKSPYNTNPTESVVQIRKNVDGFMQEFEPILQHVEQVYWAGGEPIIMDEHWYIMNRLLDLGRNDIRIFYNTNFTNLRYKQNSMIDLWKQFKNISIGASLDAEGARAEYQRKGTEWNTIVRNVEELRSKAPNIDFYVSATVSAYNAWHITDFHRSWVDKGYIRPGDWYVNVLLNHPRFRMSVLPTSLKESIKDRWKEHIQWLEPLDHIGRATEGYKSAIKFLDDDYTDYLEQFKKFNQIFDEIRADNFYETFPELRGI